MLIPRSLPVTTYFTGALNNVSHSVGLFVVHSIYNDENNVKRIRGSQFQRVIPIEFNYPNL